MPATTATSHTRSYSVDDDGDAVQLHLVEAGHQVGGGLFPIDALGEDVAFDLAKMLGDSFVASARPRSAGLS